MHKTAKLEFAVSGVFESPDFISNLAPLRSVTAVPLLPTYFDSPCAEMMVTSSGGSSRSRKFCCLELKVNTIPLSSCVDISEHLSYYGVLLVVVLLFPWLGVAMA